MTNFPPRIAVGEIPALHRLGAVPFQSLVRDLLSYEVGVKTASLYGINGNAQDGIDVLVRCIPAGVHVAQCKCYESIDPADIRAASDEFFKHIKRWKGEGVERFLLATTADCSRRSLQDEIAEQIKRFDAEGISYETWDAAELIARMRPHRAVVSMYFASAEDWIRIICGPEPAAASLLSAEVEYGLSAARRSARQGRWNEAMAWLDAILENVPTLATISSELRAQIMLFGVLIALYANDLEKAEERFAEAERFAEPNSRARARARIAARKGNITEAISSLTGLADRDCQNLLAAFHLSISDLPNAWLALADDAATIEPDADTYQYRSVAAFAQGDLEKALQFQDLAEQRQPDYESIREWKGQLAYYRGLAVDFSLKKRFGVPEPIPPSLVRRDAISSENFRRASEIFKTLSQQQDVGSVQWRMYTAWALAALANDLNRPVDGDRYALEILSRDPRHPWVLEWVFAGRVSYDTSALHAELRREFERNALGFEDALLLVQIEERQSCREALKVLDAIKPANADPDQKVRWSIEYAHCAEECGLEFDAMTLAEGLPAEHRKYLDDYIRVLRRNRAEMDDAFKKQAEEGNDSALYFYADGLVKSENWAALKALEKRLLSLGTPNALGFAVAAAYYSRDYRHALRLIQDYGLNVYGVEELPLVLLRSRAQIQHALGNIPEAVSDMELVCQKDDRTDNILLFAQFLAQLGDTKRVAIEARALANRADLDASQALAVARFIQFDDRNQARTIWLRFANDVPDELVPAALTLGYALQLENYTKALIERMVRLAEREGTGIELVSAEEIGQRLAGVRATLVQLGDMYARGQTVVHSVASAAKVPLIELYHAQLEAKERKYDSGSSAPLFVRHGGRAIGEEFDFDPSVRLHIDITSLLLVDHLELLDRIEAAFPTIVVSRHIPLLLQSMIEAAGPQQPLLIQSYEGIRDAVLAGLVEILENGDSGEGRVDYFDIIEALATLGEITPQQRADYLASWVANAEPKGLIRSQTLNVDVGTLAELHKTGALPLASDVFRLALSAGLNSWLNEQLTSAHRRTENRKKLLELRRRISQGVERKQVVYTDESEGDINSDATVSSEMEALSSLFAFQPRAGDALWIDDRALNAFSHRDGVPIFTIIEVLQSVVARGHLTREEFYNTLQRLRKGDVRFIPLFASEIVFWLRAAPIGPDGTIQETVALATLRRYTAKVSTEAWLLQPIRSAAKETPGDDLTDANPLGETSFKVQVASAVAQALIDIWLLDEPEAQSIARAEWILKNLYAAGPDVDNAKH